MKIKQIRVTDIVRYLGDKVLGVDGNISDIYIDNLAEVERVNETTLDWINHPAAVGARQGSLWWAKPTPTERKKAKGKKEHELNELNE